MTGGELQGALLVAVLERDFDFILVQQSRVCFWLFQAKVAEARGVTGGELQGALVAAVLENERLNKQLHGLHNSAAALRQAIADARSLQMHLQQEAADARECSFHRLCSCCAMRCCGGRPPSSTCARCRCTCSRRPPMPLSINLLLAVAFTGCRSCCAVRCCGRRSQTHAQTRFACSSRPPLRVSASSAGVVAHRADGSPADAAL